MDFQVCAIILIVFLVSLVSLLFINRKLSGGKSFEDILAEKRQLADKLYGSKQQKKPARAKVTNVKKTKEKKPKDKKEHEQESQNDSDAHSDSHSAGSNNSPAHISQKGHVEFSESEIIPEDSQPASKKLNAKKQKERKNSGSKTSGSGILTNKSDPTYVPTATATIETLNHFEQIVPKDDFEVKKQKDENIDGGKLKKDSKKGKTKKDSNVSPKNDGTIAAAAAAAAEPPIPEKVSIVEMPMAKESPKSVASKEKMNKKKKNEQIIAQKIPIGTDDISVNFIMSLLGKAELSRSEIQILIDYLLNKQQDSIAGNHSEWSDDIVQKLKRQLADKDRVLIEEQEAAAGLQQKLREMRTEINTERVQNQAKTNAFLEELNAKKMENQTLTQEIQIITDKFANEKQTLATQLQQLYQENQGASQETTQKMQQLNDANNLLTKENFSKTRLINDLQEKFHQIQNETTTKIGEYEQKLQEYDMIVRQGENQMALLNTDNQHLRGKKDDYEKMLAMQKYELEKLSAQIAEQNAKSNHIDDASKVEIRNLQNALDSSNNELTICRNELSDTRSQLDDMTLQLNELKSTIDTYSNKSVQQIKQVDELSSALANYKSLIADKESKIADYEKQLQNKIGKEDELFKQIAEFKDKNNLHGAEKQQQQQQNDAEQMRAKQILQRLFPDAPAGPAAFHLWIDHLATFIEQNGAKMKQNAVISANNNSEINNSTTNHVNNNSSNDTSNEELILQNAKLQTTVDEYKTIVAETESLLKKVEQQVQERDAYWKNVVELKDSEIQAIKNSGEL